MTKNEKKVHEKVMLLCNFHENFGREPKATEEYNGIKIGAFLHNVRQNNVKISFEDKICLEKKGINLIPKNRQDSVHEKVILLGQFYNEFGRGPKIKEKYKGINIGFFLGSIRRGNTKILKEDEEFLEKLGVKITNGIIEDRIHEKVVLLAQFYSEFRQIPKVREEYKGVQIGRFLRRIRAKNTIISKEERKFLEGVGINILN